MVLAVSGYDRAEFSRRVLGLMVPHAVILKVIRGFVAKLFTQEVKFIQAKEIDSYRSRFFLMVEADPGWLASMV